MVFQPFYPSDGTAIRLTDICARQFIGDSFSKTAFKLNPWLAVVKYKFALLKTYSSVRMA
jgi:hypothetical protein